MSVPLPEAVISLEAYDEFINMMLVAEPGWGKTVLCGTADQRRSGGPKALFLATEAGTISAARQGSTADVWPMKSWGDVTKAYNYFRQGTGCDDYQWALLDSITEMQKFSMDNALRTAYEASKKNADPDVPQIQDHLKVQQQTLNFLRRFNDLPINCVYTALPLRLEDAEGNPYFLPALDGKQGGIAQQAMGYMHVVGHGVKRNLNEEGKKRLIRRVIFQSMGPYKAKDRYGVLGNFMDDITIPQVEELINKGKAIGDNVRTREEAHSDIVDAEIVEDGPVAIEAQQGAEPDEY
jgi:hypothetical protein